MSELKPCPFCGGEAGYRTYISETSLFNSSKKHIYVKCKYCNAESATFAENVNYSAMERATEAWNRRVGESDESD